MTDDYEPSTSEIREAYALFIQEREGYDGGADFDRWLALYTAKVRVDELRDFQSRLLMPL